MGKRRHGRLIVVDINKYATYGQIQDLGLRLGIPDEPLEKALLYIKNGGFSIAAPYFSGLFTRETAPDSAKAIVSLYKDKDGALIDRGFGILAVYLAAALHTRDLYAAMGIDLEVFYNTMRFFRRSLYEKLDISGTMAFCWAEWSYRQLALLLFRLGELEFEMRYLDADDASECGLPENEPVLKIHIPSDAVMTRDALDETYRTARSFFVKYFPEFGSGVFYCTTWLLSPVLKGLLPKGSRILEFQSDYKIVAADESDDYLRFLFKTEDNVTDFSLLPENTSLRRSMKKFLLDGGKMGYGAGFYRG